MIPVCKTTQNGIFQVIHHGQVEDKVFNSWKDSSDGFKINFDILLIFGIFNTFIIILMHVFDILKLKSRFEDKFVLLVFKTMIGIVIQKRNAACCDDKGPLRGDI